MAVSLRHVSSQTSIGAVEGFFDAYRKRNLGDMMRYCNPKGQIRLVSLGREGEIQFTGKEVWRTLMEKYPDLTNTVGFIFSDLDGHVSAEVVFSGTSLGKSKQTWSHAVIFEVSDDGRIQKIRDYGDKLIE
jgi:hypothetical protein